MTSWDRSITGRGGSVRNRSVSKSGPGPAATPLSFSDKLARLAGRLRDPEWRRYGGLLLMGKLLGIGMLFYLMLSLLPTLTAQVPDAKDAPKDAPKAAAPKDEVKPAEPEAKPDP